MLFFRYDPPALLLDLRVSTNDLPSEAGDIVKSYLTMMYRGNRNAVSVYITVQNTGLIIYFSCIT